MINPNPDNYVTRSPPIIALGATTSAFGVSSPNCPAASNPI